MFRRVVLVALAAACLTVAACAKGGHTRGMFSGNVIGKTESEIVDKYGQPAKVDRSPERTVLVYTTKTFDPDNENRVDPETLVFLGKDKDGRVIAIDVAFKG